MKIVCIKHGLDSYEEGIVEGLMDRHSFTEDEALNVFQEYRRCIELLNNRLPNCEYYSDLIAEYHEKNISGREWEAWIMERRR